MKLHLPTRLRAAVLACITAVAALSTTIGTGVVTVGSVTYVMAASQAQAVVYSGTIYTYTGSGNVSAGPYVQTNYDSGTETFTLTGTSTTGWDSGALSVNSVIGNVDANAVHHTVRFAAGSGREVTLDFAPLTVGGFIVDEGATGYSITYGGGNRDRHVDIGNSDAAHTAAYSSIKENFTLNVSASTSTSTVITLKGTQTWDIATGKTMTLTAPAATTVRVLGSSAVSLMGGGTMNVTNSLTLSLAGLTTASQPLITVAEGTTLQYGSLALVGYSELAGGVYSLVSTSSEQATAMATALNMTEGQYIVTADSGILKLTVAGGPSPISDAQNIAYAADTRTDGYEVLSGGNLKINNGSGSAGGAAAGAVSNIGPVTVNEGGTLTVWAWQQSKRTLQTDDKVSIASNITLNGGTVFIEDGSYNFTGTVAVSGSGTIQSQYAKGYTFSSLTGGADAVLTIQQDNHDANCATLVNILNANADFAGTVNLKNVHAADSPVALDLVLSNASALSNAKLSFDAASTSPNNLVLNTESASLVALSGTGNIISSNEITGATAGSVAAATLTVTNADGTYAGNISDHIGMVIAGGNQTLGAVTLNGTLTVNAGATLTLNGALDLHHAIVNNGTVALDSGVQFDLSHLTATAEGVYTLFEGSQAVNLSSLGTANVVSPAAGYNYVFSDNGTVQAVLTCQDLTWSGGALDWHVGSVMNDEKAFAAGDMVTFNTADAAVTVSENITSTKVTVDSGVTAALTGTGQTLTVGELAVNGTLSLDNVSLSTSGMALAGELVLKSDNALAEGTALKNSGTNAVVTIAGAVQSGNARFGTFAGKIRVADGGTLTLVGANGFGSVNNTVVADTNGVVDVNGAADHGYTITLNGGSLVNTGAVVGTGKKQFSGLKVTADSFIGGTSQFGVIGGQYAATTVTLNGNTLTKTGANVVNFANTTVTAGVLRIAEGSIDMFKDNCHLNCDLDIAGGSLTGAATAMAGDHTIAATGTGGTIGCALTSTGAVTVDTAADAALNITGNLTAVGFSKLGEGSLTMSNLAVSKQLAMNYEGSLTLTAVSVAADTVLSYAGTGGVISLGAEAVQGALTIDVIKLTAEQLAAGVNLGISSSVAKESLTVAGLSAADYTIESHEDQWWLTATKAVETPWDKNWDSMTLVKAPATVVQGSLTETTGLYGNATYDNGTDTIAISLTGEGGAAVEIYGGANSDANNAGGTVTRNTWIEAKSGTYAAIVGGNLCNNWAPSAGSVWHLTGDTHIMIDGATVTNVIGGNSKDAKTPSLTGNTYVSVVSGSVTGSIVGGSTNAHNNTTNLTGDTHVFVYTPVAAKIIGGGQRVANDARCTNTINGNTNVTIQTDAVGEFAGRIVAGTESDGGLQNQTVNGNTNLTIDAASATFAESIIGGHFNSYSGGSGDSATSKIAGSANTVLNSGTYNGVVIGGSFVNDHGAWGQFLHSEIAKINLTINGGTYNNTIYGGSVSNCIKNTSYTNNGAIALNLNGGTINGDIYAAGEQSGTKAVTASSVTVTVAEDVTIAENHILSGGYKVNEGGNASVATVEGGSSLILNGGTRAYTGVTVKDFTSVTVSSAEATVTTGALTSEGSITKLGAGALAVAEGSSAASLAVNAGSLTLSGANTITALSVASGASLDMTAATALGGALTLAEGATLVTSTADSAMGVTGLNITSGMTLSIADAAAGYSDAIKLFSGLTTDTITGLTFADEAGVMVADISGIITVSGVSSDYNRVVLNGGTLSLVSTAVPAEELTWLGGDGTWGGDSTPWTGEGGQSAYVAGAAVTIGGVGGEEGGTITVSGDQTAASLTIAESGYSIQRAASGQNSLTVTGALTVKEDVSFSSAFLPTVGSIALEEGSELFFNNAQYVNINGNLKNILGKVTEDSTGTLKMTGGVVTADANRLMLGGQDFTISGVGVHVTNNMAVNTYQGAASLIVNSALTVDGELRMESLSKLDIQDGAEVTLGTLTLGHAEAGHPGHLAMAEGGSLTTGTIQLLDDTTQNTIVVTGGTLTITGANAFTGTGTGTTVSVSNATIATGAENDTAWSHASTLTDVTLAAATDHSITVGATGIETTLAGTLTNTGTAALAGTLVTTDLTDVTNSGDLTINAESLSLAGLNNTGSVVVKNGEEAKGSIVLTAATTAGGNLSAADVTLTGANTFGTLVATGTVTSDDTLTVGDGSDMAAVSEGTKLTTTGDVSIGSEASLAALSNAGNTLTVDGALTLTAATTAGGSVVADSLSLTGVNTFETLTLTGAVTLDTASYTSVGLTAAGVTGNSLALVVDETTIVSAIGASTNALTLANVTGLTSATINGESSFTSGSREYTLSVTEGLVQITATVTNEVVWEGTAGEVWGDASAWESGTEPTADSNVMFNDKGIDDVKIGGTAVANSVIVESSKNFITDASGTVETHSLEINSGTLSIGEGVAVVISGKDEAKGNTAVSGDGNIIIKGALETDVLAAASKDVQLSGSLTIKDSALIGSIGGITEGQDTAYGDLTVGDEIATTAEGDPVAGKVTLAEDSTVQNLTVTSTGDLTAEKKLTVLGDMLNVGSTTVKGDLTQGEEDTDTDTLTNNGTLDVTGTLTSENLVTESGSTLKAANLAADTLNTEGDITVTGTTTVSGDLTATGGEMRTNKLTMDGESATLDVSGAGTIVAVGGSSSVDIDSVKVTNGGLFSSQSGNITADTITVSDAGSTLSANNKNATITADSVSVKNGGAIQSDAGAALTSSIKTDSLTIDGADSVVKIKAVNAKTAGSTTTVEVTNGGALAATNTVKATNVTVTGANSSLTAGGSDTVTGVDATTLKVQDGASFSATSAKATNATVDGTGTTATIGYGGLTTEETLTVTNGATLQGAVGDGNEGGDINAKTLVVGSGSSVKTTSTTGDPGNITVEKLEVASTGSVAAAGTLKVTDEIIGTAGEITADTLDLSGLTAAAAIADLKADTITLAGFDMLKVTDALTDKAGTGLAQVVLSLDAATLSSLTVGEELTVIDTTDSFTLTNLGAINTALKAYGLKGEMVESGGKLVMQIQDNSFLSQLGTTKNGLAGLGMADHAAAVGVDPKGDLAGILAHLDDLRTAGTEEAAKAGDKIGAALSGASAAAMGLALSGDVDRQLKAIRNRTTIMGVNQAVVNEGLPYINAWVNAEGDYSDIKADGTLPGYKLNSWGGTVGFDVDCTPTFTCGLAATAMYGDFDANSADKATGDLNTYYVSAFGRIASHRWTHTFVATAGMADTTLNRTVDGVKTKGESDGMMFGGMYEVGYVFALDKEATTCLQPIFNVSYTHTTLNGYQEKGSDVALSVGDVELNKLTVGLGARLQSVIGENIYNRSSLVEARALVKFHAGDRQGEVSNAFVKYAGSADAKSVETGAIGGEFGVGLTVPVGAEGGNIFMDASAEIRAEYINVNGTVGYRVNF